MKRYTLIFIFALMIFLDSEATAFWWSDTKETASGLDVATGFDVNTITTLTGTVVSLPEHKGEEQHAAMSIATTQGAVKVVLGPWWYWEKQSFSVSKNQELAISGSLAQGRDGELYLFAQRLENRSSGDTITLRSETGAPMWSRNGSGGRNGNRQPDSSGAPRRAGNRTGNMRGGRR
jgi:hypothetical protein